VQEPGQAGVKGREDPDDYSQPGALFRLMTPSQQQVPFENTARSL
jgi:catalase